MAKSGGNRSHYAIETPRTEVKQLFATLNGAAAADLTPVTAESANGEIVSATRTGAGVYNVTFRYGYPQLKQAPTCSFIAATAGLIGSFSAFDVVNGTGTLRTFVGSTPTDVGAGDQISIAWSVRNSGKNN